MHVGWLVFRKSLEMVVLTLTKRRRRSIVAALLMGCLGRLMVNAKGTLLMCEPIDVVPHAPAIAAAFERVPMTMDTRASFAFPLTANQGGGRGDVGVENSKQGNKSSSQQGKEQKKTTTATPSSSPPVPLQEQETRFAMNESLYTLLTQALVDELNGMLSKDALFASFHKVLHWPIVLPTLLTTVRVNASYEFKDLVFERQLKDHQASPSTSPSPTSLSSMQSAMSSYLRAFVAPPTPALHSGSPHASTVPNSRLYIQWAPLSQIQLTFFVKIRLHQMDEKFDAIQKCFHPDEELFRVFPGTPWYCFKKCAVLTQGKYPARSAWNTCTVDYHGDGCPDGYERPKVFNPLKLCYPMCERGYDGSMGAFCYHPCDEGRKDGANEIGPGSGSGSGSGSDRNKTHHASSSLTNEVRWKARGTQCQKVVHHPRTGAKEVHQTSRPRYARGKGQMAYQPKTEGVGCHGFGVGVDRPSSSVVNGKQEDVESIARKKNRSHANENKKSDENETNQLRGSRCPREAQSNAICLLPHVRVKQREFCATHRSSLNIRGTFALKEPMQIQFLVHLVLTQCPPLRLAKDQLSSSSSSSSSSSTTQCVLEILRGFLAGHGTTKEEMDIWSIQKIASMKLLDQVVRWDDLSVEAPEITNVEAMEASDESWDTSTKKETVASTSLLVQAILAPLKRRLQRYTHIQWNSFHARKEKQEMLHITTHLDSFVGKKYDQLLQEAFATSLDGLHCRGNHSTNNATSTPKPTV